MSQQYSAPPAKPGIADPATRQALLEKARRGLLASKEKSAVPHIAPRPAGVGNPLSFSQQRMWFLEQLTPGTAVHSIVSATRLTGELNVEAMARTLNEIVRRHDTLRATFTSVEGEAVQHIAPALTVQLPVLDFTGEADPEGAAQSALSVEAERPFDLETGPLLRAFLFRIATNHHILLVVLHHIISDGWSTAILSEEIQTLYSGYVIGQTPSLPDLPIQYSDVAHWQQEWLKGEGAQKQLAYWQKQLQDAPELLELPTDYPRPPQPDYRGGRVEFTLPPDVLQAVKAMAQAENATPFMVLLAAFNVLLARYSRQEDITVGYPVAGRTHTEMESLIGLFLNTLVLRTDLSGNPTFRDLVARVRDVTLEASQHQELPFEHLVKALNVERRMSHTPLFQVFFVSQNAPHQSNHLPGLTLSGVSAWSGAEPFDLSCYLLERGDQLEGELRYRRELFEEATMVRMSHQFVTLLTHAIASPTTPIEALPLLTPTEASWLIQRWNQTQQRYPHVSLPALIEAQAYRTPNAIALITETEEISYKKLLRRMTYIAHALKGSGVKAGDIVGLGVDRGANLVVGALGILQAGAAYLPLDPAYPAERLAYMLEDAGATLILTETHLRDTLPLGNAEPLYIDILLAHGASSILNPLPPPPAEALAYVIYTSGSTGKPKGVQIAHAGLINFLLSMQKEPGLTADDTFLAIASLSFDIAGLELYLPLMIGGRVLIASRMQATDGYWLKSILDSGAITVLQATPATWRLLLEAGWEGTPGLKMMVGAEPIPPALAEDLIQRGGELWNMYGPTETTVWSSVRELTSRDITVGAPIDNLQYYVLDAMAHPVPLGVPGELYIGGDGLAWGYRGKFALTADRFVPDPFSGKSGARLYRTGDVVRLRDDGTLIFVGRVDHQVKVRGFRIELGEIETAMELHPDTRQAIVVVRETQGHKQLVAYIVVTGTAPTPAEWRTHLRQYLPDYMIPALYVTVPAMPLTLSGKVNRRALMSLHPTGTPFQEGQPPQQAHTPPGTPTERALAEIWAQVLGRDGIGVEENFFDLGGHSLLGAQVIARIASQLQVQVPLRALFEAPTIAHLAMVVESSPPALTTVRPPAPTDSPPLSYAQERLFFLEQLQPGNVAYNLPIALRLRGALEVATLHAALNGMIARHASLRTTFYSDDGVPRQRIAPILEIPLEYQAMEGVSELDVTASLTTFLEVPFDIAQGPLIRAIVVKRGNNEHILGLGFHHLIADGWSAGIMMRDLATLYNAFRQGQPNPLSPVPVEYSHYARHQRNELQGATLKRMTDFWRTALAGAKPVLELPTDHPRGPTATAEGATYRFALPADLTTELHTFSRRAGVSLYMTLLAAFQTLLSRYARQESVLVGTPIANRNDDAWETVVGLFVNTLVMRADFGDNPTFATLLQRVRDFALSAYAHQELPFERLVETVAPERSLAHSPLFQVLFTFNNMPLERLRLTDVTVTPLDMARSATQFDIGLAVMERDGQLLGEVEYNRALFESITIARMAEHWETLLRTVVQHPHQPVGEIPLLTLEAYQAEAHYRTSPPDPLSMVERGRTYAPPKSANEMILARIWEEVLRLERVGIHDSFFDLGGDSILSLQIIARANRAGLTLAPHQIFEYQTIAELASVATPPVAEAASPVSTTATPQFSGARLNQGQLNQVMKKLKGKG